MLVLHRELRGLAQIGRFAWASLIMKAHNVTSAPHLPRPSPIAVDTGVPAVMHSLKWAGLASLLVMTCSG